MADRKLLLRLELDEPVSAHDETLSVLELRQPKGGDLMDLAVAMPEGMDENGAGGRMNLPTVEFASKLANVPPATIRNLSAKDAMAVAKAVNPFLLEYLGTYAE
ncbi:phage tail assembly protein [Endozoicomonas acroporae]|uniref:phage tail assembly protein n=1 Tax=Endozoicomonas acroporae TaxID=1701104 RepID=UPI0013D729BF|nr:phage tail assembly protein [Endozoicomonas acroporae]